MRYWKKKSDPSEGQGRRERRKKTAHTPKRPAPASAGNGKGIYESVRTGASAIGGISSMDIRAVTSAEERGKIMNALQRMEVRVRALLDDMEA